MTHLHVVPQAAPAPPATLRPADLARVAQAISQQCHLRLLGQCDLDCLGRLFCDLTGLVPIQEDDWIGRYIQQLSMLKENQP